MAELTELQALLKQSWPDWLPWKFHARVFKKRGSSWRGRIVGWYTTGQTEIGFAIESDYEPNAVQVFPMAALAAVEDS